MGGLHARPDLASGEKQAAHDGQEVVIDGRLVGQAQKRPIHAVTAAFELIIELVIKPRYVMTRYTWKTSAYSRLTLIPCVRARLRTYSAFA